MSSAGTVIDVQINIVRVDLFAIAIFVVEHKVLQAAARNKDTWKKHLRGIQINSNRRESF